MFSPNEIENFAKRTQDKNPLHQRDNSYGLGQIVMGTHLVNQMMCTARKVPIEKNLKLTMLDTTMNNFLKSDQEINWETPEIIKRDESIRIEGYIPQNKKPIITLDLRMSQKYETPENTKKIFLRRNYELISQDMQEPEFPVLLIPSTLIEWKTELTSNPIGINLQMQNQFYNLAKPGEITIEIGFPTRCPKRPTRKARKRECSHIFRYYYVFMTQTRQKDEIISTGEIKVGSPDYLPVEYFKPLD